MKADVTFLQCEGSTLFIQKSPWNSWMWRLEACHGLAAIDPGVSCHPKWGLHGGMALHLAWLTVSVTVQLDVPYMMAHFCPPRSCWPLQCPAKVTSITKSSCLQGHHWPKVTKVTATKARSCLLALGQLNVMAISHEGRINNCSGPS